MLKAALILCLVVYFLIIFAPAGCYAAKAINNQSKHIIFAGYEWEVKQGRNYPGKNNWLADNVWLDKEGYLHLRLNYKGGRWYSAEITSLRCFDYGLYEFQVIGSIDKMDPNVVLGLFVYPGPENVDKENEIDIEFTKWGNPSSTAGSYTVTPAKQTMYFSVNLTGSYTTQRFTWTRQQILFQSFYGHMPSSVTEFSRWLYNAEEYMDKTAVPPVRVHINLWLLSGKPPLDGEEQEIIIRSFRYQPLVMIYPIEYNILAS